MIKLDINKFQNLIVIVFAVLYIEFLLIIK